jgi:hypothetical protein
VKVSFDDESNHLIELLEEYFGTHSYERVPVSEVLTEFSGEEAMVRGIDYTSKGDVQFERRTEDLGALLEQPEHVEMRSAFFRGDSYILLGESDEDEYIDVMPLLPVPIYVKENRPIFWEIRDRDVSKVRARTDYCDANRLYHNILIG